jgi:soluble lytic murein transglycosylase-like protein
LKKLLSFELILSAVLYCAADGRCAQKTALASGPIIYEPMAASPGFAYNPKFDRIIEKYAHQKNLDPFLIKCLIKVESDYNPNAVSPAGAAGLMQLMQETAWHYGVIDRTDPESNIRAGVFYLSSLLVSFHGDVSLALAAYHAGGGRVKKNMAVPPIQATIDYVNLIMYYYSGEKDYIQKYNKMLRSEDFVTTNIE